MSVPYDNSQFEADQWLKALEGRASAEEMRWLGMYQHLRDKMRAELAEVRLERDRYKQAYTELAERLDIDKQIFFRRKDGIDPPDMMYPPAKYHLSRDGIAAACASRMDLDKYDVIERLDMPEEGLCKKCRKAYMTPPRERNVRHSVDAQNGIVWKSLTPDENPLFNTYVYVFKSEGNGLYKIGISSQPKKRLGDLKNSGGAKLRAVFVSQPCTKEKARDIEWSAHFKFQSHRRAGEWFDLGEHLARQAAEYIEREVAKVRNLKTRRRSAP